MKVGRNDPCPCGSGEKYKRCCATKKAPFLSGSALAFVVLLVLGGVAAIIIAMTSDERAGGPLRVWSAEHGHYHDSP